MTLKKILLLGVLISLPFVFVSCGDNTDGNADYDWAYYDGKDDVPADSPYKDGYGRLPNSLRLATYNVHRCEPPNNSGANYDNTAAVIANIDADVIALQELDDKTTLHPVSQIEELARRAGMKYTFGQTIPFKGGKYGNGVLSKTTPISVDNIDLVGTEHRRALVCEFSDYVFIATHFCHQKADNRTRSAEILNEYVTGKYSDSEKTVYLAGDLNDSNTGSEMFRTLQAQWEILSINAHTFPSTWSRLDYVLIWKGNEPEYEVIGTAIPSYKGIDMGTVSDHLPVLVDVEK